MTDILWENVRLIFDNLEKFRDFELSYYYWPYHKLKIHYVWCSCSHATDEQLVVV